MPPFVSVVVPVFDDLRRLGQCLQALESQTYNPDRYEVLVVDNGSPEPVASQLARFPHARGLAEARAGSYVARNAAIGASRGEVLAFTDADCLPAADWLAAGVRALSRQAGSVIGGCVELFAIDAGNPRPAELYDLLFGFDLANDVSQGHASTANLFVPRSAFELAGVFDSELRSRGDREWCGRARAAGFSIVYGAEVVVRHPARATLAALTAREERLTGGIFAAERQRSRGPWASLYWATWALRPPLRAVLSALRDRRVAGYRRKLSLIACIFWLRYVRAREWLRLELGGQPRR